MPKRAMLPLLLTFFTLVTQSWGQSLSCPVCGTAVNATSTFAVRSASSTSAAQQNVYACSVFHAQRFRAHPMDYQDPSVSYTPTPVGTTLTSLSPRQCPFCTDTAVSEHYVLLSNGQKVHSCSSDDHYQKLFNETALSAALSPASGTQPLLCPVCKMAATTSGPYAMVNSSTGVPQKVFTCSTEHAQLLATSPLSYKDSSVAVHNTTGMSSSAFTYITPTTMCPFCRMAAVDQHAVYFRGGQALHACVMKHHYGQLNKNNTAVAEKLTVQSGSSSTSSSPQCPVCGMEVTDQANYVSFKNGAQKIYTCSASHAQLVYDGVLSFATRTQPAGRGGRPQAKLRPQDWTYVEPSVECPFCSMQAVVEHELPFNYGQTLHACEMTDHYASLYVAADLRTTMTLVTAGTAVPSTARYCMGMGTVMLNGFTFKTTTCLLYLFQGWVL
eukprot:RCo001957